MKPPSRENVCVIPCQFWTLVCYNSTCICLNIQFTKISQASYYQYKNPIYIQTPILKHIHTYIYIHTIHYIIGQHYKTWRPFLLQLYEETTTSLPTETNLPPECVRSCVCFYSQEVYIRICLTNNTQ